MWSIPTEAIILLVLACINLYAVMGAKKKLGDKPPQSLVVATWVNAGLAALSASAIAMFYVRRGRVESEPLQPQYTPQADIN